MKEKAVVVALEDDSVWVETRRQSSCSACSASEGCGQGIISRVAPGREHYIRALVDRRQHSQLVIGDTVSIAVPDESILHASVVVYLVPLLMLIAGMFGGNYILPGDGGSIAGGFVGLLLGAAIVRWHSVLVRDDTRFQARVVEAQVDVDQLKLAD
jgi:sigma-E factor negative regulatory protein RseC